MTDLRLRALLRPHLARTALAAGLGTVSALAAAALLATSTALLTWAADEPPVLELSVLVVSVRALALLRATGRYGERLALHDVAFRVLRDVRVAAFRRLLADPAATVGRRGGELVAEVVGDVDDLRDLLLSGVVPLVTAVATSAAVVATLAVVLPGALPAVAAALLVAGIVLPLLAGRLGRASGARVASERTSLAATVSETLGVAEDRLVHGTVGAGVDEVRAAVAATAAAERSRGADRGWLTAGATVALGLATTLTLVEAVTAHAGGTLDHRLVGALALLVLGASEPLSAVPTALHRLAGARAAAARLAAATTRTPAGALGDAPPDDAPAPGIAVDGIVGAVGSHRVGPIDLDLSPGRRVALMGPSGAGKSLLLSVLEGLREPDAGVVRDGDGRVLDAGARREAVALAPQTPVVLATTIAANLRIARPDADDGDLRDALADVGLTDLVARLPHGLDTTVGAGGRTLSGGEAHRLALARTLLAGRPVLALDEPTSDLDPVTAVAVLDAAARAAGPGRALVVSTHEPLGLRGFDEVVVLDAEGRVTARGAPSHVLAGCHPSDRG